MRTLIVTVIILFFQLRIFAQYVPFTYTYGGTGIDMGYDVVEALDSGYVSVGQIGSDGFTFGSSDVFLFKTDINGQLEWRRNFGGINADGARSIALGHGGGYLIAGYTNSFGNGGYDYYVIRTDAAGDTIWTRTYGGSDWDFAYSVCKTSDGAYLVAGETFSYGNGGSDIWVLKINDFGDTLSTFLWGEAGNQTCREIKEYGPGKAVIVGNGLVAPNTDQDPIILGINHITNNYIFETVVPYVGDQEITSVDTSHMNGFVTFGIHAEDGHSDDLFVQYYGLNGSIIQNIEIAGANEQYDLAIHSGINYRNQSYYVSGSSRALGSDDYEAVFFKLATLPYVLSGRLLTGPKYNSMFSTIQASDKGIVMAGVAEGFGPGPSAAIIWKLDSLQQSTSIPIPLLGGDITEDIIDFSLFPNPFQQEFYLSIPELVKVTSISIWDIQGRLIYNRKITESGTILIQPGNLSKGLYTVEFIHKSGKRYYKKIVRE